MANYKFRKSSYSTASGECVEVATNVAAVVAVRDSKWLADGSRLRLPAPAWQAFLTSLAAERRPG